MDKIKWGWVVIVGLLIPVWAGAADYVPQNISGGWVRRAVEAPSSPGTFYSVSWGIFKSIDGGLTWNRMPYGDPPASVLAANNNQVFGRHCTNSVAVCPTNANLVIAGDEQWSPIWRSTDGGNTWTCITLGSEQSQNWKRTSVVAPSLASSSTFFAAIEPFVAPDGPSAASLYSSTDAGLTWAVTSLTITAQSSITDIVQIPGGANGRTVVTVVNTYLGFNRDNSPLPSSGTVLYSDDNFATYSVAGISGAGSFDGPYKMTWDGSSLWLITSQGSIYSSADKGATWTRDTTFNPTYTKPACHRPVGIIAGPLNQILAFVDQGTTPAVQIYSKGTPNWNLLTLPAQGSGKQIISWFCNDLVFNSSDATGNSWGLADSFSGFFTTTDAGNDFTRSTGICTVNLAYGIKDSPTGQIYALGDGIYYSGNSGANWNMVYPQKDQVADACWWATFDPQSTDKVYIVSFQKIFYTLNHGTDYFGNTLYDFSSLLSGNSLSNLIIDPSTSAPNQVMYIGQGNTGTAPAGHYLLKSTNSGLSWSPVNTLSGHGIYYLAMDPTNPQVIYAGCGDHFLQASNFSGNGDGLYKTTDGGATWNNLGFSGNEIPFISVDPTNTQNLLVGYVPSGTYSQTQFSSDGGAHWLNVVIDNGTGQSRDQMLKFDNNRAFFIGNMIYAGDPSGSIYAGPTSSQGILQLGTVMPTSVTWIFKGSVLAATGSGLYNLTFTPNAPTPTPGTTPGSTPGVTGTPFNLKGKTVLAYPNPGKEQISFITNLEHPTDVRIDLFSSSGDRVATLKNSLNGNGAALIWNCQSVAPGIYIARVIENGSEITKLKVAVIRK